MLYTLTRMKNGRKGDLRSGSDEAHLLFRRRILCPPRRTISNTRSLREQRQELEASRRPLQQMASSVEEKEEDNTHSNSSPFEIGNYYINERIGKGGQGEVFLGRHKETGELVAVKIRRKKAKDNNSNGKESATELLKEASVMYSLQHDNIVRLLDVSVNKDYVVVVMEYAARGDLGNYIKSKGRLTLKKALRIFKQLIRAVSYFHSCNVIHRDLVYIPSTVLALSNSVLTK